MKLENRRVHSHLQLIFPVKIHVDPPYIPQIKIKNDLKTEKYYVKIKFRRNPTSEKRSCMNLYLYFWKCQAERIQFFYCGIIRRCLERQGCFTEIANIQYLCNLLRGKALKKIKKLCVQFGNTKMTHLNIILFGLGKHFLLSKHCLNKNTQCSTDWGICINWSEALQWSNGEAEGRYAYLYGRKSREKWWDVIEWNYFE